MKKYDATVKITDFQVDWLKIKSACMTTVSKQTSKDPSMEWKKKLLISRHSPIRRGVVSWKWEGIPYAISTHFARHHEGCEKFIGTERSDRTGIDRESLSQMNLVPMEMDANLQALMNISEKRLCMSADITTRQYWESLMEELRHYSELVVWANVPQCVRCGGCVEMFRECHFYEKLMEDVSVSDQQNVMKRYDIYNEKVRKLVLK